MANVVCPERNIVADRAARGPERGAAAAGGGVYATAADRDRAVRGEIVGSQRRVGDRADLLESDAVRLGDEYAAAGAVRCQHIRVGIQTGEAGTDPDLTVDDDVATAHPAAARTRDIAARDEGRVR